MLVYRHVLGISTIAWCAVVWTSPSAHAGGLVLESYASERPADADTVLEPVRAELSSRGHLVGTAAAVSIVDRMSRAAQALSPETQVAIEQRIAHARDQYSQGDFRAAAAGARGSVQALLDASGYLARTQNARSLLREALVLQVEALGRLDEPERATRAMAELVRSFPNRPLTTAEYSPNVVRFYHAVAGDLEQQGRSILTVMVDDPSVAVFINEEYIGGGEVNKELLPGRYRVYTQQSAERPGRVHLVNIDANIDVQLSIAWGLDAALATDESFVGFSFEDERNRRRNESAYAVRVARAINADSVFLVGIRTYNGSRSLLGAVISMDTGKQVRSAHLALTPAAPTPERIREMARFLAGDEDAGPFKPIREQPLVDSLAENKGGAGRPYRSIKWISLIAGVGTMVSGGALISMHRESEPDRQVPYTRNSRPAGIGTLSVGAALVGLSVYFWVRDARDRRTARIALEPANDGLRVTLSRRF